MRVNSSQLISAGGSSSSKVRGQVSHSRLQRLVTSRYRQTGGVSASAALSATPPSQRRRGARRVVSDIRHFLRWLQQRTPAGAQAARKPQAGSRGHRRSTTRQRDRPTDQSTAAAARSTETARHDRGPARKAVPTRESTTDNAD